MKYKIFLVSLFYSILFFSQTNNGIVKYECSLVIPNELVALLKNKRDSIKDKYIYVRKFIDESEPINFTLKFNKNESIFSMDEKLELDNKLNYNRIIFKNKIYYTNQKDSISLKKVETYGGLYLVKSSKYQWELNNTSKKIGKYTCYKATLINDKSEDLHVEAWYAPTLNNSITPLGFNGLPGAILELTRKGGRFITKFKATDIKYKKKEIKIKKPTKGKKVTQEEFINIGKEAMEGLKNR